MDVASILLGFSDFISSAFCLWCVRIIITGRIIESRIMGFGPCHIEYTTFTDKTFHCWQTATNIHKYFNNSCNWPHKFLNYFCCFFFFCFFQRVFFFNCRRCCCGFLSKYFGFGYETQFYITISNESMRFFVFHNNQFFVSFTFFYPHSVPLNLLIWDNAFSKEAMKPKTNWYFEAGDFFFSIFANLYLKS